MGTELRCPYCPYPDPMNEERFRRHMVLRHGMFLDEADELWKVLIKFHRR